MLRVEIDSLVESGFEVIQLLAPSIAYNKEVDFGLVSDSLKIITDGLKTKTILHTYFGDVSTKIESLLNLPVSGLGFDITTTPASSIEKHSFSDKILTVGIINSFNTAIEKPQECINQVDEINAQTKPKESYVSNNFDLEYVPKEFAMNKISVLGEIARGAKDV
jgi:methionine synthase II (cobalamin-independent)